MLYRSQMTEYARAQVDEARQILSVHQSDGTGCCPTCGRSAPCGIRAAAERTHEWYASWLTPRPIFGADHRFDHVGRIVRPYIENLGRSRH